MSFTITRGRVVIDPTDPKERASLIAHFEGRPVLGPCPPPFRVPVYMKGYISGVRTITGLKDFEREGEYDGFDVVVEDFATAKTGKEDSFEAFDLLIERTAKSYEGTARNGDIAPIFRALADRFHQLLAIERLNHSVDLAKVQALNWMAQDKCRELVFVYPDEEGEPGFWAVFQRTGNVNDREWNLWGKSYEDPYKAICDAAERQDRGEKPYPERTNWTKYDG